MDLAAFIDRYDQAWNDQDVDTIMSMHTPDMVFENHTRGVRVEGPAVRELLESTFEQQPDMRFSGRAATSATTSWSASGPRPRRTTRVAASSGTASTSSRSATA